MLRRCSGCAVVASEYFACRVVMTTVRLGQIVGWQKKRRSARGMDLLLCRHQGSASKAGSQESQVAYLELLMPAGVDPVGMQLELVCSCSGSLHGIDQCREDFIAILSSSSFQQHLVVLFAT